MGALKAVVASVLAVVIVGGLYIGSALLGYFLAALAIVFVILGTISVVAYVIYEGVSYAFGGSKKKKTLY